jgi:nitrogenase molybdenum-iron protein beta chain
MLTRHAGNQGAGYAGGTAIPCTNSSEREVVFGGDARLRGVIDGAIQVMDADLFAVLTGCTGAIVGDDVDGIAADYRERGVPMVNVDTGGFKANNYVGHELVMEALIQQYIGPRQAQVKKGLVNVFAPVPFQNPFWAGDLDALRLLLEKLGFTPNVLFGYAAHGVEDWQRIPDAEFNLLISPWVGLSTVQLLEQKYGTPYLHYPTLPLGAEETNRFLRALGEFANLSGAKVASLIGQEETMFYDYFDRVTDFFAEYPGQIPVRFELISDSLYGLGFASYLVNELGLMPESIFVTDHPPEAYHDMIRQDFANISADFAIRAVIENDGGKIASALKSKRRVVRDTLLLGSSWDGILADSINAYLLELNAPVSNRLIINHSYVGYQGGLRLVEDIYTQVMNSDQQLRRMQAIEPI